MNDTHIYLLCLPVMMALNPKNLLSGERALEQALAPRVSLPHK